MLASNVDLHVQMNDFSDGILMDLKLSGSIRALLYAHPPAGYTFLRPAFNFVISCTALRDSVAVLSA